MAETPTLQIATGPRARRGLDTLLAWITWSLTANPLVPAATKEFNWSHAALVLPTQRISGKLVTWGQLQRMLSDRDGNFEVAEFTWTVSDYDRELLNLLDNDSYRFFPNRLAVIRVTTMQDVLDGLTPPIFMRGMVQSHGMDKARAIRFSARDWFTLRLSPMSTTEADFYPSRQIQRDFWPNCPDGAVGLPEPTIYGKVDSSLGPVPLIPLGAVDDPAGGWQAFLVAGHAIKELRAIFRNGEVWSAGNIGVDVLAPGFPGWPHPQTYIDKTVGTDTRRYTIIYARGPWADEAIAGTATLTAGVYGVETVGNGTGTLILPVLDQFQHWCIQYLTSRAGYRSGNWLANPPMAAGIDTTPQVNTASFTEGKARWAARLASTGLTYIEGAGMYGANGDRRTRKDWLRAWANSCDCRMGFNREGQFSVAVQQQAAPSASVHWARDVIEDSFAVNWQTELMRNVLPYSTARDWARNAWTVYQAQAISNTSVEGNQSRQKAEEVELWFIGDPTHAGHVMLWRLIRISEVPRAVTWSTGLYGYVQTELGDTIMMTHPDGPGANVGSDPVKGWIDRPVFVERVEVNPGTGVVTFTGEDIGLWTMISVAFVPGPPQVSTGAPLDYGGLPPSTGPGGPPGPQGPPGPPGPAGGGGSGGGAAGSPIYFGGERHVWLTADAAWQPIPGFVDVLLDPAAGGLTIRCQCWVLAAGASIQVRLVDLSVGHVVAGTSTPSTATSATAAGAFKEIVCTLSGTIQFYRLEALITGGEGAVAGVVGYRV